MTREHPPVVSPPFSQQGDRTVAEDPRIVAVVLAAGMSSRFGPQNKLLADWAGAPVIVHAVRTAVESRVDAVHVVVGHDAERVRAAVEHLDVSIARTEAYARGQSASVCRGVRAARDDGGDVILFVLGDMPAVAPESLDALIAGYLAGVGDPIAAACNGVRGNPVLFGSRHFDALLNLTGDDGGRELLLTDDRARCVETGDPGILVDVDRRAHLDKR